MVSGGCHLYIFLAGLRLEVCMWAALAGTTMARGRSTVNLSRMARWLRGSFGQVPTVLAGAPIEEVCPSFLFKFPLYHPA